MKIEKISDNKIRCTLSKHDLDSRNIKISELAYGTLKVRKLFRDMMKQAAQEYGFDTYNSPLLIEAIPISDTDIVLNISRVDDPDELDTRFSRFTPVNLSEDDNSEIPLNDNTKLNEFNINTVYDRIDRLENLTENENADFPSSYYYTAYFLFDNLNDIITASRLILPYYTGGNSSLNKIKNEYLLLLQKQDIDKESFNYICNLLSECGRQIDLSFPQRLYYANASQTIIENKAVEQLAGLEDLK